MVVFQTAASSVEQYLSYVRRLLRICNAFFIKRFRGGSTLECHGALGVLRKVREVDSPLRRPWCARSAATSRRPLSSKAMVFGSRPATGCAASDLGCPKRQIGDDTGVFCDTCVCGALMFTDAVFFLGSFAATPKLDVVRWLGACLLEECAERPPELYVILMPVQLRPCP